MSAHTVQIDALPQYEADQSNPLQDIFAFAYTITVTNTGTVPVQLISRHWVIQDERGHTEEVKGLGVVGQQPLLRPGESFQYSSGCRLRAPSGTMHGSFFFVAEDGHRFDVSIATFVLESSDSALAGRTLH
ncbi:Co2+/Mg2+ efflux protein ApaG [Limnohabitans sp.]|jgi:ApaG protein|uniref:Co2+/Mg2+ efflux protein ApaG n=1 Tax=Limnohabitans sp. TaxID=1907725 RepID=UPI001B4F5242|nr:Co2+/Mg2+ efflux protein ApaG [Limnohabitans sp.]MBP6220262.1 Co2+/Mg2+ efflux protein ApaG [Limnohabitans sp.]MBP6245096.1 Co2+/Mg2+ efflux protein ApaG [Limnohabitans sp.]